MKKLIFIFSFFLIAKFSFAQVNLVPNPSFEQYDTCPYNTGQIYYATPWFNPTQGTPDYLNSCVSYLGVPSNFWGYQSAHTGDAYAGFIASLNDTVNFPDYREYIEIKLDSALRIGTKYFVSFYLSLADSMNFATDALGVCFSPDTLKNDTNFFLNQTPQIENYLGNFLIDKLGWLKLTRSFIAQGGEFFLTIGNFKNDFNTNTIPVSGGASPPTLDWSGGYYYLDDVCVSTDSLYAENWTGILTHIENETRIFPNPASTEITVESFPPHSYFSITDLTGREIAKGNLEGQTDQINVTTFPNGIYFLILNNYFSFKITVNH